MFEEQRALYLSGIAKCDNFLKNFNFYNPDMTEVCSMDKVPPDIIQRNSISSTRNNPLVRFYANAKIDFINRLVKLQEVENAFYVDSHEYNRA